MAFNFLIINSVNEFYVFKMKNKVVDCFMLMGTAFAIHGGQKMPEMGIMPSGDSGTVLVSLSFQVQHFDVIDAQNMVIACVLCKKFNNKRVC